MYLIGDEILEKSKYEEKTLCTKAAADILGCSVSQVYAFIKNCTIPAEKVKGCWRIPENSLMHIMHIWHVSSCHSHDNYQ